MAQDSDISDSRKEFLRELRQANATSQLCLAFREWSDQDLVMYYNSLNPVRAIIFMAIYYRYGEKLLVYIFGKLNPDNQGACDVWNKFWKDLWEESGLDTFNPANPLLPWLYLFANNRIREHWRNCKRYVLVEFGKETPGAPEDSLCTECMNEFGDARHVFLSQDTINSSHDFADTIIARLDDNYHIDLAPPAIEESMIFRNVICSLSKKEQDILKLKFNTNKSYEQIALELEVPVGTIKGTIHRAKKKLSHALDKHLQQGGPHYA